MDGSSDGTKRFGRGWRALVWLAITATAAVAVWAAGPGGDDAPARAQDEPEVILHLPLSLLGQDREGIQPPSTARPEPSATPLPASATPTQSPEPTPTEPEPTEPPTPTLPAETGDIFGHMTFQGAPLDIGFGSPGTPQIELRRRQGADGPWELVANAEIIDAAGRFVFEDPPALSAGQTYQVWWDNPPGLGADLWLGRWWSRDITVFGDGADIDVGVFEVVDLTMTEPCHDCGQTPPIVFEWEPRDNASETYRWAVFDGCDETVNQRFGAWLSADLGHASDYETGPPAGFRLGQRYCWFVRIDDGQNGGGWPYYARRVTWLASAAMAGAEIAFD